MQVGVRGSKERKAMLGVGKEFCTYGRLDSCEMLAEGIEAVHG